MNKHRAVPELALRPHAGAARCLFTAYLFWQPPSCPSEQLLTVGTLAIYQQLGLAGQE